MTKVTGMIAVYASELAACIGMNRYRPVSEAARKVWCRCDPEGYRRALLRNDTSEPEPIADTLQKLQLTETVTNVVEQSTPETLAKDVAKLAEENKDSLALEGILLSDVTSFVLTERGKNSEGGSLDRLEKSFNIKIRERNDKFYKRIMTYERADGTIDKFLLGGKVDGITEDGCLVEVKNRQYRLFPDLPPYEKVQIHAYMFLTGITECKYVQSFKGEDVQEILNFDNDFWDMIKNHCIKFVKTISTIMNNEKRQDRLLSLGIFPDADEDDEEDEEDEEDEADDADDDIKT